MRLCYLNEILPGGKIGDQVIFSGVGVGDRYVQSVVGQLMSVGGENQLHSASEEEKVTRIIHLELPSAL